MRLRILQEEIATRTVQFEEDIVSSAFCGCLVPSVAGSSARLIVASFRVADYWLWSMKDARALEAEGKTGLVILSSVTRVLQELRSNPKSEQHYAICTSGESAAPVPANSMFNQEMIQVCSYL